MDIDDSLKAQEAWAIESFQEIKGQGIPTRVIKLMKDINSEARKVAYRGSGIKKYERLREAGKQDFRYKKDRDKI